MSIAMFFGSSVAEEEESSDSKSYDAQEMRRLQLQQERHNLVGSKAMLMMVLWGRARRRCRGRREGRRVRKSGRR